jgi:hypothetical protein
MTDEPLDIRGITIYHSEQHHSEYLHLAPEMYVLGTALIVYSKAFVEALAKRHADGLADLVRARFRKDFTEAEVGLDDDAAATIVVTEDLPDEARLALLDLDLTADAVRGKVLRWDSSASAWQPDPDD